MRFSASADAPQANEGDDVEDARQDAQLAEEPETKSKSAPQYVATIVVNIVLFMFGMAVGWPTVALPALLDADPPVVTLEQGSWLASIFYIVATFALPPYSYVCERFGRKWCGYATGACYLASAVVLAGADSFPALMAARVLFGAGAGGNIVLVPVYVSEIAEDRLRGRLGAFVTLLRSLGILFAYAVGAAASHKALQYAGVVPPLLFLVAFYFLPETPTYLLRHGKEREAEKALRWLRGGEADARRELQRVKEALRAMDSSGAAAAKLRDLVATRGTRKALAICFLLCCNQLLCGFFGVVSYTFIIFQEAGGALSVGVSNVIVGLMLVFGVGVSMMLYDRLPRRFLLNVSNVLMVSSLLVLSVYFYLKEHGSDVSSFGWLPVAALSVYVIGYNAGAASLPIIITTELFSPKLRNLSFTILGNFCWICIFVVTLTFPMMTSGIGFPATCWFYISWCVVGVVVTITMLPETKNRKLESILDELENGKKRTESENIKSTSQDDKIYESLPQEPSENTKLSGTVKF